MTSVRAEKSNAKTKPPLFCRSSLRTKSMAGADKKKVDTVAIATQMRDCCFSENEVSEGLSFKISHRK